MINILLRELSFIMRTKFVQIKYEAFSLVLALETRPPMLINLVAFKTRRGVPSDLASKILNRLTVYVTRHGDQADYMPTFCSVVERNLVEHHDGGLFTNRFSRLGHRDGTGSLKGSLIHRATLARSLAAVNSRFYVVVTIQVLVNYEVQVGKVFTGLDGRFTYFNL